jgi:hypothetical protein
VRKLPTNPDEWFTALLRPFKAYTWFGFVLFACLGSLRGIPGLRATTSSIAEAALFVHLASLAILLLGTLLQLVFPPRREALSTFGYALCGIIALWLYLPLSAFSK